MKRKVLVKKVWYIGALLNSWVERLSAFLNIFIIIAVFLISTQAVAFVDCQVKLTHFFV